MLETLAARPTLGHPEAMPDPEVPERPARRRFTAEYKLRIVEAANALTEPGAIGALLRREGLYSSHLVDWRRQYRLGALSSLARPRGRPKPHPLVAENESCVAGTPGSASASRPPNGSSRSREKSPSSWGSRSPRAATTTRAGPDGDGLRGRSSTA